MAKILVFQHVPYEPLGTLDPLLRAEKHRIRYVNFGRNPNARPKVSQYDALVILGGPMNIGEEASYPHLAVEKACIQEAMANNIPILGICLGAQLIASALGADVYRAESPEIGWFPVHLTQEGRTDPLARYLAQTPSVFQWHGHTFEIPESAELLLEGEGCRNQGFRVGDNIYGFQFHLEANLPLIQRWLNLPQHQHELGGAQARTHAETIWQETLYRIDESLALSKMVFREFLSHLPGVKHHHTFIHREFA